MGDHEKGAALFIGVLIGLWAMVAVIVLGWMGY